MRSKSKKHQAPAAKKSPYILASTFCSIIISEDVNIEIVARAVGQKEYPRRSVAQISARERLIPNDEKRRSDSSEAENSLAQGQPSKKYRGGVLLMLSAKACHMCRKDGSDNRCQEYSSSFQNNFLGERIRHEPIKERMVNPKNK